MFFYGTYLFHCLVTQHTKILGMAILQFRVFHVEKLRKLATTLFVQSVLNVSHKRWVGQSLNQQLFVFELVF